jgi:hypothetical protein
LPLLCFGLLANAIVEGTAAGFKDVVACLGVPRSSEKLGMLQFTDSLFGSARALLVDFFSLIIWALFNPMTT